jgi:hypothetical protein
MHAKGTYIYIYIYTTNSHIQYALANERKNHLKRTQPNEQMSIASTMVRGDREYWLTTLFHQMAIGRVDEASKHGSEPDAPPPVSPTRQEPGNAPRSAGYIAYRDWVLNRGAGDWNEQTKTYLEASEDVVDEELEKLIHDHQETLSGH